MKYSSLIAACVVGSMMLTACGDKKQSQTTAPVKTEIETIKPETTEVVKTTPAITLPPLTDPNTATLAEMLALPGMPENIPALIVENRPFASAQALDAFLDDHANPPTKVAIYRQAFIPMPLNTTPEKDFKIIPGVGKKMAHEFEEYRPYANWDQFNREIGKYVDAREVARLRRYVTLD